MRVRKDLILREIAGEHILIPVGEQMSSFHGIMVLNGSGLLLWEALQKDVTEAELIEAILATYDVDPETAGQDVREFIGRLEEAGVLIR